MAASSSAGSGRHSAARASICATRSRCALRVAVGLSPDENGQRRLGALVLARIQLPFVVGFDPLALALQVAQRLPLAVGRRGQRVVFVLPFAGDLAEPVADASTNVSRCSMTALSNASAGTQRERQTPVFCALGRSDSAVVLTA
jgi:hypothetical protein